MVALHQVKKALAAPHQSSKEITVTARTRKNTTAETQTDTPAPTSEAPAAPLTLEVRRSEGVQRAAKTPEFNPTQESLELTLTEGPLAFDLPTEDQAKQVVNLLQRAASNLEVGLTKSITPKDDGTWTVDFCASPTKRTRKYSANDIRQWAKTNGGYDGSGYGEITGRIPAEVREAFKVANGFAPATTEEANDQG